MWVAVDIGKVNIHESHSNATPGPAKKQTQEMMTASEKRFADKEMSTTGDLQPEGLHGVQCLTRMNPIPCAERDLLHDADNELDLFAHDRRSSIHRPVRLLATFWLLLAPSPPPWAHRSKCQQLTCRHLLKITKMCYSRTPQT